VAGEQVVVVALAVGLAGTVGALLSSSRVSSAVDHLRHGLGVAVADDGDGGRSGVDLGQVVSGELHVGGAEVLLEPLDPPGAGNRHDPRLLGEQPGERDLGPGAVLGGGDAGEQVDDCLVGGPRLSREPRQVGADVALAEGRGGVDAAGEEAAAERAERDQADAESFEGGDDLGLGLAPEQ
jgi:hypothetical protein